MNEMHYQRIDKGITKSESRPPKSPKADLGSWIIPEGLDPYAIIERYLSEPTTSQIAAEYGLSRKALVKWLRLTVPEKWKEAQIVRALCRKDDGDEGIETACDALSLARAREQLKSGQWDLERLDSASYGQKHEVTHIQADLGERLRRARERVIEGEVVAHNGVMSNTASSGIRELQVVDKSAKPVDKHSSSSPEGPIESKKAGPGG